MKVSSWGALGQRTALTPEERIERRRLIVRDALALLSLFGVMLLLFAATLLLFQSFVSHRAELAQRWLARGETALAGGHPNDAIDALHSALAYDPSRRITEIELAQALGAAGRTEEALAYFNTLLETEPGNGRINLELARLAARQGNQASAKQHYQFALDGTWQGDGYVRRREIRLELARYLLQTHDEYATRNELLIAAGNAPNDPAVKLEIGALMEQAHDPASALGVYRSMMVHSERAIEALEGAGRSEFALGHFAGAKDYLQRAMADKAIEAQPVETREQHRQMLADSIHILEMYPSPTLRVRERAERVFRAYELAKARLADCPASASGQGKTGGSVAGHADARTSTPTGSVAALASRVKKLATRWNQTSGAQKTDQTAAAGGQLGGSHLAQMNEVAAQWTKVPAKLTRIQLEQDPELEQTVMLLVYQTEITTAEACGTPIGKDALLLRIAQAPDVVEQR